MSHRHSLRLAAIALPVLALVPTAAHAEKVVTHDPAGDVVMYAGGPADETVPAPDHVGTDLVRTSVAHGEKRLRVNLGYQALERDPFQLTVIGLKTSRGAFEIVVERLGGSPITSIAGRHDDDLECRGLKSTVNLRTDVVSTSLPTSCLGAPQWVRVGAGAIEVSGDVDQPELAAAYADDAHRAGEIRDNLAFGPKVRRG